MAGSERRRHACCKRIRVLSDWKHQCKDPSQDWAGLCIGTVAGGRRSLRGGLCKTEQGGGPRSDRYDDILAAPFDTYQTAQIFVNDLSERVIEQGWIELAQDGRHEIGQDDEGHVEVDGDERPAVEFSEAEPLFCSSVEDLDTPPALVGQTILLTIHVGSVQTRTY